MAKDTYEGWTMSKIQLHHPSLSSGNMFTSFCYVIISTGFVFVSHAGLKFYIYGLSKSVSFHSFISSCH